VTIREEAEHTTGEHESESGENAQLKIAALSCLCTANKHMVVLTIFCVCLCERGKLGAG